MCPPVLCHCSVFSCLCLQRVTDCLITRGQFNIVAGLGQVHEAWSAAACLLSFCVSEARPKPDLIV